MFGKRLYSKYLPVAWIFLSALALVADYMSGPNIQFPILYIVPIGLAAWYSGPWWGGCLAVTLPFGRVIYWTIWQHTHEKTSLVGYNTTIRITAFLLLVFLIHQVIKKSKDVATRIETEKKLIEQQKQLRALSKDLAVAEEVERRRIAAGLHDDINQMLIAAKLQMTKLSTCSNQQQVKAIADDIDQYLDRILKSSQSLIFDLVSPVLQKLGLEAALEDLCERMSAQHGIEFRFESQGISKRLKYDTDVILFHVVHELLRNVVRHAEAESVDISFSTENDMLKIVVRDDGKGFYKEPSVEGPTDKGGFGLFAIRERMQSLGGSMKIGPAVGNQGVRIELVIPLSTEEHIS